MTTPMMKSYEQIKTQHPDTIVFMRLGDFFEALNDDAKTVADVCDTILCSRVVGKSKRIPMTGFPYFSAEKYIEKLITAGHKVALVEPTEDDELRENLL